MPPSPAGSLCFTPTTPIPTSSPSDRATAPSAAWAASPAGPPWCGSCGGSWDPYCCWTPGTPSRERPTSTATRGASTISSCACWATTLGNHDFDNGVGLLVEAMEQLKHPNPPFAFVNCNFDFKGTPALGRRVQPYL